MPIAAVEFNSANAVPRAQRITGIVLTVFVVLFMLFDAVGKFVMPVQVIQAFVRIGVPQSLGVGIGVLLTVCTLVYAIPRTAVLGAVLLTAYLGGAVAIQIRAGSPTFETIFPVILGVFTWAGILLREPFLRAVFPFRRVRSKA